jgi:uncharacterized membrane protein
MSHQAKIFSILCLSTAFCFVLVGVRIHYSQVEFSAIQSIQDLAESRGMTFMFLVWNLFLAWIPYWISISIPGFFKLFPSKLFAFGMIGLWLLFFPNAPYIITDLLHLHHRYPVPFWFDLMLLVTFAWTGLMLGLISLHEIRLFVKVLYNEKLSWAFTFGSVVLCGFGIYLGRCLRFNSWDILTRPMALVQDILLSTTDSMAIKLTLVFSAFLMIGYLTLNVLMDKQRK